MTEKLKEREIITKKNIVIFLKKFGLSILILSPVLVFLGGMYIYQYSFSDAKNPFVQWSGLDPRTDAVITWETEKKEGSCVWYGTHENDLNQKERDDEEVQIHRIHLSNLRPEKEYYYRVGVAGSNQKYRSSIFSFKTAPNETNTNFDIIVYSDSQQFLGIGWHNRISNAIAKHNDISFVANVGDLCQNWDYKPDWNQFFHETSVYMRKFPFVPCLGNHDGYYHDDDPDADKHYYETYFGAIDGSADPHTFYYSFNWSNAIFIVGEISKGEDEDPDLERNEIHDTWLKDVLNRSQDKTFRILMFHRQVFSGEDDNEQLIDRIVPIVKDYNVSLILYGHHHHYQRFFYKDATYLCLGGGGGQQFGSAYTISEYTEAFAIGPSYTKISIDSDEMTINTYSPEGDLIDNCILEEKDSKVKLIE